jgi:hypothetical protein
MHPKIYTGERANCSTSPPGTFYNWYSGKKALMHVEAGLMLTYGWDYYLIKVMCSNYGVLLIVGSWAKCLAA